MEPTRRDLYNGLFLWQPAADGPPRLTQPASAPTDVPDPATGRPLRVATVETSDQTICPLCAQHGAGGFVSFVADLRLAYACPQCRELVWLSGL